jgi:signal transduction histidine kinase/DNA-binding response OmpR family regulator/HPt (histidine-containing phosphotransfer) domain-containing protein
MIKQFIKKNIIFISYVFALIVVSIILVNTISYITASMRTVVYNIRQRLMASSKLAAQLVTAEELEQYQTIEDMKKPSYKELRNKLRDFAQEINVLYVHYQRPSGDKLQYIVDNDFDEETRVGLDTKPYAFRYSSPWILKALEDGETVCTEYRQYVEGWEGLMTAYSPIFDKDGNIAVIAGIDIDDEPVVRAFRMIYILTISQIIVIIIITIFSIIGLLNSRKEAEKANAANVAKNNFLSQMSHEIRTPLNTIMGMGELALYSDTIPKIYEYLKGIKQAGQNLLRLIDDILDFSKIETGSLEIVPAPYYMASLLDDIINIIQIRIGEKPILFTVNIEPNMPARLVGDESRVRQILFNLLSNAVKFTRQGRVELSVSIGTIAEEKADFPIVITVTDTGIGIKEEDMGSLFKSFTRLDMVINKSIEGSGLGLSITRSICQAMGGSVTASSEYGKGSVFTATVPQGRVDIDRLAVVDNPKVKVVLLYDHHPEYLKSLTEIMRNLGVIVVTADSADDFLERLADGGFSYAFISEPTLEQARAIIKDNSFQTVLVLLLEIGKPSAAENVMVLSMPAYAVPVANVLNGKGIMQHEMKDTGAAFVAPAARLLVVDDIQPNLVVAEGLLTQYKSRVDLCSSGARALELVKEQHYDLVFMDHMMPEMDGIETVKRIRQREKEEGKGAVGRLRITALTANAVSGMKEMFLKEGFDDFLSKPIEPLRLREILKIWLPLDKQIEKKEDITMSDMQEVKVEQSNIFKDITIDGIDLKKGQDMFPNNKYLDVLRAWCMHTPALLDKLRDLTNGQLADDDIGEYTIAVHGLKGSSYGICAQSVGKKAENLEAASRQKDIEFVKANNKILLEEAAALHQNLEKLLASAAEHSTAKPSAKAPDTELLKQFLDACKQFKSSLMEEILEKLDSFKYESGGDLVQWLREQTDNLEYDAMEQRLTEELANK